YSEVKELFAQSVFVSFLCSLRLAANLLLSRMRLFPLIHLSNRMIYRYQRLFLLDRSYPLFDGRLIGSLHLIEFRTVTWHFLTPLVKLCDYTAEKHCKCVTFDGGVRQFKIKIGVRPKCALLIRQRDRNRSRSARCNCSAVCQLSKLPDLSGFSP